VSRAIARAVEWIVYLDNGRRFGRIRKAATGFVCFRVLHDDDTEFAENGQAYTTYAAAFAAIVDAGKRRQS